MKKNRTRALALLLAAALAVLTAPGALAAGAGPAAYVNTRQVADNLQYTNTISYISGSDRQESFALTMTGAGDAYPLVMACDTIYGGLTIGNMVSYAEAMGKNVLAAVNTDFFSMETGVPAGLVVENGVYKSSPEGKTAVAFTAEGGVVFSKSPQVTVTLSNAGSVEDVSNAGQAVSLTHFNKYRTDTGGMYLFSEDFSTVSTRTSTTGWFVRFKILDGAPSVSGTMTLQVEEAFVADGAFPIGEGYLVLTAATNAETGGAYDTEFEKFKVGDMVTLTTACSDPALESVRWATGAGDILIEGGALTDQAKWDAAIRSKNPRTAFGIRGDGSVVSYVVDGRAAGVSSGLTLMSLAEELLGMGCVWAVNFDGGGSSALSLRLPGQAAASVVNRPSDGAARRSGAYLLFVTDRPSDGQARLLGMENDGAMLLAGSSIELKYTAADSGYRPVAAPADTTAVSAGLGHVAGGIYTAGHTAGVETLALGSGTTGASGYGSIHIIQTPTTVQITNTAGTQLQGLMLWPGETVQLAALVRHHGRAVTADASAYKYEVSGPVGTVTPEGLFTAGSQAGESGTVALTVGGASISIPVTIGGFSDITGHWGYDAIRGLADKGIVTGVTATTFSPESNIKRGDFVLMLHRAVGKPAASGPSTFEDVQVEDYYAAAIAWAESIGVAQGTGPGRFEPQATLTREQAFTLVYRALGALGVSAADGTADSLSAFSDRDALQPYAVVPTATLVSLGVVSGSGGRLEPASEMTRAQMAKVLYTVLPGA